MCPYLCRFWKKRGAFFILAILSLILNSSYWFGVKEGGGGSFLFFIMKVFLRLSVPVWLSSAVWGAIMLVTAVYGINALDKLNKIAVPALFVITIAGTIMAVNKYGVTGLGVDPPEITMSLWTELFLTVSFMAAGCLAASDITRYQATRKRYYSLQFYWSCACRNFNDCTGCCYDEGCTAV